MDNVARVLKMVTAKTVFWVVAGSVTIAKCVKTGRFTKRDDAQWLYDNVKNLSRDIAEQKGTHAKYTSDAYKELTQAVQFFGIRLVNDDSKLEFKKVWLGIVNQSSDHYWDDNCPMIAA